MRRTRTILQAALLGLAAKGQEKVLRSCNYDEDLRHEFSECDSNGETRNGKLKKYTKFQPRRTLLLFRTVYFYFETHAPIEADESSKLRMDFCKIDEENAPTPKPIFSLPCHDNCPDGSFASVNRETKEMICEQCQKNTYSVGSGGIRIDGTMGAFGFHGEDGNVMPLRMELSCQVTSANGHIFKRNNGCTHWSKTGTSLKAYESSIDNAFVDFDLSYPVFFDELGTVEFKFRKDTIVAGDTEYGEFKFLIDGVEQDITVEKKSPMRGEDNFDWTEVAIDEIPKGFHNLIWRYTKLNIIPFTKFMEAEIEVSFFNPV